MTLGTKNVAGRDLGQRLSELIPEGEVFGLGGGVDVAEAVHSRFVIIMPQDREGCWARKLVAYLHIGIIQKNRYRGAVNER